jgi:hypothetical protein
VVLARGQLGSMGSVEEAFRVRQDCAMR